MTRRFPAFLLRFIPPSIHKEALWPHQLQYRTIISPRTSRAPISPYSSMAAISMQRQSHSPRKASMSREVDHQAIERARARLLRTLAQEVHQRIQIQSMRPQTAPHLYKPRYIFLPLRLK
jgi:hypothetical protein